MTTYEKKGYLNTDFKIFYLTDNERKEYEYHYHDFHKILIFLNGNTSYFVEGKTYDLNPGDIVLVSAGDIHRPVINGDAEYERLIIYISPDFFEKYNCEEYNLSQCFNSVFSHQSNLVRIKNINESKIMDNISDLISSFKNRQFAMPLYQRAVFVEFIINLNRELIDENVKYLDASTSNKKVLEIIEFINKNLTIDISIDLIATHFFLNRSYLMHLFKAETGYTIIQYITDKRLYLAKKLISTGCSVTDSCFNSGFKNYPSFYRAFKSKYNVPPKQGK